MAEFVGDTLAIESVDRVSEATARLKRNEGGDAVLSTDRNWRVTFLNPSAEKLVGWTHTEASGREFTDVFQVIDAGTRERIAPCLELEVGKGHTVILAKENGRNRSQFFKDEMNVHAQIRCDRRSITVLERHGNKDCGRRLRYRLFQLELPEACRGAGILLQQTLAPNRVPSIDRGRGASLDLAIDISHIARRQVAEASFNAEDMHHG
jgi:PAS domain S-box-containing protein